MLGHIMNGLIIITCIVNLGIYCMVRDLERKVDALLRLKGHDD